MKEDVSSSLAVFKAFLLPCGGEGLAWETCNIDVYLRCRLVVASGDIMVDVLWSELFGNHLTYCGICIAAKQMLIGYAKIVESLNGSLYA